MASVVMGNKIAKAILDELGIPADRVIGITLTCDAGQPAVLEVRHFIDSGKADGVSSSFKNYEIREKDGS